MALGVAQGTRVLQNAALMGNIHLAQALHAAEYSEHSCIQYRCVDTFKIAPIQDAQSIYEYSRALTADVRWMHSIYPCTLNPKRVLCVTVSPMPLASNTYERHHV